MMPATVVEIDENEKVVNGQSQKHGDPLTNMASSRTKYSDGRRSSSKSKIGQNILGGSSVSIICTPEDLVDEELARMEQAESLSNLTGANDYDKTTAALQGSSKDYCTEPMVSYVRTKVAKCILWQ